MGEKTQNPQKTKLTKLAAISILREQVVEPEVPREFTNPLISHFWHVPSMLDSDVGLDYKLSTC